jgi:hypothetical protein
MSLQRYDFSTSKLSSYFGGASPSEFTTLWGLNFCPPSSANSITTAAATWTIGSAIGETQHAISMTFTGTERDLIKKRFHDFVCRALCHAFIDGLPDVALEEIAECIADNYDRHVARPRWRAGLSVGETSPQLLQGRLGAVKQRPEFHLGDE